MNDKAWQARVHEACRKAGLAYGMVANRLRMHPDYARAREAHARHSADRIVMGFLNQAIDACWDAVEAQA